MKKIYTLLLASLCSAPLIAAPVSQQTAELAGKTFLQRKYAAGVTLTLTKTYYTNTNQAALYVFSISNSKGFVIVSADDVVQPILAYSAESDFGLQNIPANIAWWMDGYRTTIGNVISSGKIASSEVAAQWNVLLSNSAPLLSRGTTVDPLLTTDWDQMPDYNQLCPVPGGAGSSTPTGCVATAMAQIMNYWEYPATGTGSYSYTENDYGSLTASFGATTYEWANMPAMLDGSSTAAQVNAVATLMYHCGVAVEMDYDLADNGGSGAYTINYGMAGVPCAQTAFIDYFGYDAATLQGLDRNEYTNDADWIDELKSNLDLSYPILYSGAGDAGGHAWVVDGYDEDDLFHCNWGWSGISNGYFSVNDMSPDALGTGGGGGGFNADQAAIVGIHPVSVTPPVDPPVDPPVTDTTYGDLVVSSNVTINNIAIYWNQPFTVASTLLNNTDSVFTGDYTAGVYRSSDSTFVSYVQSFMNESVLSQEEPAVSFATANIPGMTPGNYYVKLLYRRNGHGNLWSPIPEKDNTVTNLAFITVLSDPTALDDIDAGQMIRLYPNPAQLNVNINKDDFTGNIKSMDIYSITGAKVNSFAGGSVSLDVSNLASGTYFIRINTDLGAFTKKLIVNR